MNIENSIVRDYMSLPSIFVYEDETIFNAMDIMKKFKTDNISIIRNDFSIVGYIDKAKIKEILKVNFNNNICLLKKTKIKDLNIKYDFPIVLYPGMTIIDAYNTMRCFNIRCIPVVDVPWEKKIIGFLWFNDILPIIEESYLKVPV